ncbi:hypothetical protein L7F22_056534 [Adiantum nelumboides]|nr:hypothetical protein [Adiantum nelumboides]
MPKSPGRSLFGGSVSDTNLVDSLDSPNHSAYNVSPVKMESQRLLSSPRRVHRVLSKVPYKVLDAPELAVSRATQNGRKWRRLIKTLLLSQDDYYLNLVDWSSADVLGVGLGHCVYLWSAKTSGVTKLCDLKETSLNRKGTRSWVSAGRARGRSTAWNEHILTSGSRDRSIYHRDVRVPQQSIRELKGHKQEVCGLKWNTMTNQLASGGNDNKLFVWDGLGSSALHQFAEHTAAVKAIAWSPHQQGLLASGGGTADMKIKYWNTVTGAKLSEVDTGSQVCNLAWSKTSNEIISTHGFSSGKVHNQVQIWRYPGMQQVASLTGHTMRVLYLAMSPDGETIVSGAGDETLRFWNLNTPAKKLVAAETSSTLNPFAKLR